MDQHEKIRLCQEIDAFLMARKWLRESQPLWTASSRPNQLEAIWPIEEPGDICRAYLSFRHSRTSTTEPSVTLVYGENMVCRIDVKNAQSSDKNPALSLELGLPGRVTGTHIHRWEHNREFVLRLSSSERWNIPIKEEISQSTRTVGHILALSFVTCAV